MTDQDVEEIDIKDLVYNKLEKTKLIRNMRVRLKTHSFTSSHLSIIQFSFQAQLRAHIYNLLETGQPDPKSSENPPLNDALSSSNGLLALTLVEDLLEKLELRHSRVVMRAESGYNSEKTTLEIKTALNLPLDEPSEEPFLIQLLNKLRPEGQIPSPLISKGSQHSKESASAATEEEQIEENIDSETVSNTYSNI